MFPGQGTKISQAAQHGQKFKKLRRGLRKIKVENNDIGRIRGFNEEFRKEKRVEKQAFKRGYPWTCLVVQWIRICLLTQETQF